MLCGKFGKDFAIQDDAALVQVADQFGVGGPNQASTGIDADLLKGAVVAFLQATITIRISSCFDGRDFCNTDFAFASPHHALGSGKDILATLEVVYPTFDSWHR